MKHVRWTMVALASLGMVCPQAGVYAASPKAASSKTTATTPAVKTTDIALAKGGVFAGRVVDDQGKGVNGAAVTIRQTGKVVAETVTSDNGKFTISNLRGGTYDVTAGQSQGVYRLWAVDTAPPSAVENATLVSSTRVVRGQIGTTNALMYGAYAFGIAGLTTGIIAINELQDKQDASP